MAEASFFNATSIRNCDSIIVFSVIDNIELFEQQIAATLPEGAVGYYNSFIKPQPVAQTKAWFSRQVYLALGVFLSACAEMGIDATPMEGIEPEKYDTILEQTDYKTLVAVTIGFRDADDFNQPSKSPKSRRPQLDVVKSI